jgi:hypothetical protein
VRREVACAVAREDDVGLLLFGGDVVGAGVRRADGGSRGRRAAQPVVSDVAGRIGGVDGWSPPVPPGNLPTLKILLRAIGTFARDMRETSRGRNRIGYW